VILITAVGSSVIEFASQIAQSPMALFTMLGQTMPLATHFYWNYLVLQYTTHAMNMMRYVMLAKFKMFSALYDEETARAMSEPEDQDYYGLGSRCARFMINMAIGIIYGSLAPPLYILTFINFALCRLFYGYLIVYAEMRKPDSGGVFFMKMMEHMFVAMIIYNIMMIGVLIDRAATIVPAILGVIPLVFSAHALHRLHWGFAWEKLPYNYLMNMDPKIKQWKKNPDGVAYVQPELLES